MTTTLREEIAEKFHDCMGYWEGIAVPDWDDGHSSIDYANQVLKLIEKRIDEMMNPYININNKLPYDYGCLETLQKVKELLK